MNIRTKARIQLLLIACSTLLAWTRFGFIAALITLFITANAAPYALRDLTLLGVNNNLGSLAATGVIHDALGILVKRLPFLKSLASDIAPAMANRMMPFNVQQILKNYNANQTVSWRDQTGTYEQQVGQILPADQYLTLNKWPFITIRLSAAEVNTIVDTYTNKDARQVAIRKLLERAFNALGTQIVNDYVAALTQANFAQYYTSAVGTMTYKTLGSAVDVFMQNDALLPNMDPHAVLEIACFRELANSITAIFVPETVKGIVNTGVINEPISGAQSISRYNITQNAAAPRGFLVDPLGMVFANRVPVEETIPNDPVYSEIITDEGDEENGEEGTGFSLLYREFKNGGTGEVSRTITTLYGFAPGLPQHVVRVTANGAAN